MRGPLFNLLSKRGRQYFTRFATDGVTTNSNAVVYGNYAVWVAMYGIGYWVWYTQNAHPRTVDKFELPEWWVKDWLALRNQARSEGLPAPAEPDSLIAKRELKLHNVLAVLNERPELLTPEFKQLLKQNELSVGFSLKDQTPTSLKAAFREKGGTHADGWKEIEARQATFQQAVADHSGDDIAELLREGREIREAAHNFISGFVRAH
eukprot:TRINITY_DN3050_c0_g1_i1.p3 TRINITY_DN3050_c0_g1~~TRINITY_DN3050_c0_g1_i1.p3  ORF type:complete len:207 (-),score=38.05 TRINITY_DN3050_c0_g1_i1:37-657(-)